MLTIEPGRLTFHVDDGVMLAADAWGAMDGPPIVVAHGIGQTRHAWRKTCLELARAGWYAIAFDHRGHGDSGWSLDGDYTLFRFAEDLRRIAATLQQRPVIVG